LHVDGIKYPDAEDKVIFIEPDVTAHNLGSLKTDTSDETMAFFSIDPSWIKDGMK
jgi:hypothetical protein